MIPHSLNGMPVILDRNMTVPVESWYLVRSPGRARRRLKRGFKQNILHMQMPSEQIIQFGNKLVMHPETWAKIQRNIENRP